jgi:hypothetical protein
VFSARCRSSSSGSERPWISYSRVPATAKCLLVQSTSVAARRPEAGKSLEIPVKKVLRQRFGEAGRPSSSIELRHPQVLANDEMKPRKPRSLGTSTRQQVIEKLSSWGWSPTPCGSLPRITSKALAFRFSFLHSTNWIRQYAGAEGAPVPRRFHYR